MQNREMQPARHLRNSKGMSADYEMDESDCIFCSGRGGEKGEYN